MEQNKVRVENQTYINTYDKGGIVRHWREDGLFNKMSWSCVKLLFTPVSHHARKWNAYLNRREKKKQ